MSTILEIGPGRGDFLFWLAEQNPDKTVAAVEYKRKRFDKLAARLEKRKLGNVALFFGDARLILPQEFADESVGEIYILYSDPWPKRRHARHRLFQEPFVSELHRILKPEGRVFVAHDDPDYLAQIRETFALHPQFAYSRDGIDFRTFYEEKWLKEGKRVTSFSYRKTLKLQIRNSRERPNNSCGPLQFC